MTIKVFTVNQMTEAERAADAAGHPYATMMEMAGFGAAKAITDKWQIQSKKFLILVGPGNNGGDALVTGRYLYKMGADVFLYLWKRERDESDDNYNKVVNLDIPMAFEQEDLDHHFLADLAQDSEYIVDGLLGIGMNRPINRDLAGVLNTIKQAISARTPTDTKRPDTARYIDLLPSIRPDSLIQSENGPSQTNLMPTVIALDCPTGLNCNTGKLDPNMIPAHLTLTFAGPKLGHLLYPGASACGEIKIVDIGLLPNELSTIETDLVTLDLVKQVLPPRKRNGHKGSFGIPLIVAGAANYSGAPVLAAKAAMKAGSGLLHLFTPQVVRASAVINLPEAIYPETYGERAFGKADAKLLNRLLAEGAQQFKTCLIGPGLSHIPDFFDQLDLLKGKESPQVTTVFDADGLNMLAQLSNWSDKLPPHSILTPHPGEMARLLGITTAEMARKNRIELAQISALRWRSVVVLKGAYTVIGTPSGHGYVLPFANPILSTAGSGDVLAGIIVSFCGQGLSPVEAAFAGGFVHGLAGELAAEIYGDRGLLASELIQYIPEAIRIILS